jgi:hypothetical protein
MATRRIPQDGDIVVRPETHDGSERFVLRTVPGADQYVVRSRTKALEQAVVFARRQHVRVWLADGAPHRFALVADFRGAESV